MELIGYTVNEYMRDGMMLGDSKAMLAVGHFNVEETGEKGTTGTTGPQGIGISSATPQYYLSTSSTSLSDGSWSNTIQTWSSGKYYWIRTHYVYTDNTSYDSSVYDSALTSAVSNAESDALNAKNNAANALGKVNAMAQQCCTQTEYDKLAESVKNNGTFYFIS